ncbi:MAG: ATP-binding protein [Lachnospiraceae bacterium]|nr:ATP-binding protein [Lachnospiraceae bacterium]
MYIERHIKKAFDEQKKWTGAVIVTGARQVGKTTLIENALPEIQKIALDDKMILKMAKQDTEKFIDINPPPLFIDEVQYAPDIFPYLKMSLDKSKKKGQYFLTGSQPFALMRNVSESLAGRAGILNMYGLSLREMNNEKWDAPFIPTLNYLRERKKEHTELNAKKVWEIIWRGSYPELYEKPDYPWELYYHNYLNTYLERDVRALAQVGDELQFIQFMQLIAARTGQILNLNEVAGSVGISAPTAKKWLSILKTSGIVYLLKPYFNNLGKRIIKSPKLYFSDTGLCAYLAKWNTPENLMAGAMSGAYFETFVINEIIKSYANSGKEAQMFYFRDSNKAEIDLLLYENGILYPIEIKETSEPKANMVKAFDLIDKMPTIKRGEGGVICLSKNLLPLKGNDNIIPLWAI